MERGKIMAEILLTIENLNCGYLILNEYEAVLTGAGLAIHKGEIIGLSGRSGSGKSTVAMAIMGLLEDTGGQIRGGRILYKGSPLQDMEKIRGKEISLVFQNPSLALNPLVKIGKQLKRCCPVDELATVIQAVGLEKEVGLKDKYPHQLSIGMCQRITIAMAIGCKPALLILDEPTASLDQENKIKIAELLLEINSKFGTSMLITTHDEDFLIRMGCKNYLLTADKIIEKQVKNGEQFIGGISTE